MYTKSPFKLALIFSATPYFILNFAGMFLGRELWTDSVVVLSSVFLGFIVGGTFSFKNKLLDLHQEIKKIIVDEKELERWQESIERNINRKMPFRWGLVIGILSILPHYYFYGMYFALKYGLVLYALNAVFLWVPSVVFITYVAWIILLEYFWIYGMNPADRPPKLGIAPPKTLQKSFGAEDFVRPVLNVRMGNISQSGFQPVASLALFGSILVGVGGGIAMPVILLGTESRVLGALLMVGIVAMVIIAFVYPLKKIYDILKWEKTAKMDKINILLEEKAKTLERMIFDSSSKGELKKSDVAEIETLTRYIDALRILESTHSGTKTLPVDMAMISKLLASAMAPHYILRREKWRDKILIS